MGNIPNRSIQRKKRIFLHNYSLENQELLRSVAIIRINNIHKIGNIGYWIRKSALNKGVATEAVSLACSFGFTTLGLFRAEIVTLPNNKASRKVDAKYEGVLQNRLLFLVSLKILVCTY